jgi:hypothetical protein
MNARHAAALALLVWYFMVPPRTRDARELAQTTLPLSQWGAGQPFDSLSACEQKKQHMIDLYIAESKGARRPDEAFEMKSRLTVFQAAQCVRDGDPRLKVK